MNIRKLILLIILLTSLFFIKGDILAVEQKIPQSFLYLTWESDGMTPIDYQAKALPTRYAIIKTSVQPLIYSNGRYLNSDQWSYHWYIDDVLVNQGQGLKENRFLVKDPNKTTYVIKVKVLSSISSTPFEKSITINLVQPLVFVRPVGEKNISDNYSLVSDIIELEAVPFFFGSYDPSQLHYMWTINNKRYSQFDNQKSIFLPHLQDDPETFKINLLIEDLRDIIIRAGSAININFIR